MSEEVKQETKTVKMVKIKALRAIRVSGKILKPGEIVSVTEEEAQDFCTPLTGALAFTGQRYAADEPGKQLPRHTHTRAQLVA